MAWRLAISLKTLRDEVNGFAPKRSKASDGTLGDPAHAARASRHNPNRYGVVTGLDLTHDPAGGFDAHGFARRHAKDPHPELAYMISNGQVAKRRNGFRWERYTGTNKHEKHVHFGVGEGPDSDPLPPYDSTLSWGVALPAPPPEDDMTPAQEQMLKDALAAARAAQADAKAAKQVAQEVYNRQVAEATVREDIVLNRKIAAKVGVPAGEIPGDD